MSDASLKSLHSPAGARVRRAGPKPDAIPVDQSLHPLLRLQQVSGNAATQLLVQSIGASSLATVRTALPLGVFPLVLDRAEGSVESENPRTDSAGPFLTSLGQRDKSETLQRHGTPGSWETRAAQARSFADAGDATQAAPLYRTLLADVVNAIPRGQYPSSLATPPQGSPAPASVTPDMMQVVLSNQPGGAVTYPSDVARSRGDPSSLWSWIQFHEESVGTPRDYTLGLILHEMQHAGDMVSAYRAWSQQSTATRGEWLDYWEEWKRQRPMRHLEIYGAQAAEANFASWNEEQKLDWIAGVLVNIPGGLARNASIPGQTALVDFYNTTATPAFKPRVVTLFFDTLFGSARQSTMPDQRVSILRNFRPIIADMVRQHREEVRQGVQILERVLRIRI